MLKAGEIQSRGGYPGPTLRYVIAQNIIPGLSAAGQGNHRQYTAEQAFLIAVACELYAIGVRGPVIKRIAAELSKVPACHAMATYKFVSDDVVSVVLDTEAIRNKLRI